MNKTQQAIGVVILIVAIIVILWLGFSDAGQDLQGFG